MPREDPRVAAEGSAPPIEASDRVCSVCGYRSAVAGEQFCPRDGAYLVDPEDLKAAENDPLLGRRISDFVVVARIGTGGMGTVYRAIQIGMDRKVALKVLRADLTDDPQVVQRFLQEAKATARLQHRNLAITYTSGSTPDGLFYIAMEYIDGGSLTQLIERSWVERENGLVYTLEVPRAMRLFTQIVSALAHAHRLGIVHRDLKPDNVLIHEDDDEGEQAKVVDFGIAKILFNPDGKSGLVKTDAHANLGTALYMAPERFAGAPGDPRLDVYALGLLLHEMVTGLLPFATHYSERETPTVLLHKRLTMAVPPLSTAHSLSAQLVTLHADLLDREPQRRPAHAGEVRQRLRDIPELAGLRMSQEVSGRPSSSSELTGSEPPFSNERLAPASRSLHPLAPAARSLPPMAQRDSLPPILPTTRSLPPLPSRESLTPGARSLPPLGTPMAASLLPPAISLPPAAISLPPAAISLPPTAISIPPQPEQPQLTSSARQVSAAPIQDARVQFSETSSNTTKWLLIGSLVLLLLLLLLALF